VCAQAYPAYAEHRRFLGRSTGRVALDYLFHPAADSSLLRSFWAGPGRAMAALGSGNADGVSCSRRRSLPFLVMTGYPNWHGGWSLGSWYSPSARLPDRGGAAFALGSSLSGAFAAAAGRLPRFATLSWPNFLDLSFPPVNGSAWFLARGWVAPNAPGRCRLAPAVRS
jgi:hypothetical protein